MPFSILHFSARVALAARRRRKAGLATPWIPPIGELELHLEVLHRNCPIIFFFLASFGNILTLLLIRSRCDDLRRNFPGLPPNETLIVDYSCALQKDILVCEEKINLQGKLIQLLCRSVNRFWDTPHQHYLQVHGRLYVTTNFLCFYANIFRWETAVTIRWREVGFQ